MAVDHATEAESSTLAAVAQAADQARAAMTRRNRTIRAAYRAGHNFAAIGRAAGLHAEQVRRIAKRLGRDGKPLVD